jgi:hypothetical protein
MFRIDPSKAEPVTVETDSGQVLRVRWPPGFLAGTAADPVVRDRTGLVVARSGQRLNAPVDAANEFPMLPGGYPVCFGGDSIWVQERLPP